MIKEVSRRFLPGMTAGSKTREEINGAMKVRDLSFAPFPDVI